MSEELTDTEVRTLLESALLACDAALREPTDESARALAQDRLRTALAASGWVSVHDINLRAELAKIGLSLAGSGEA